jgi:AcrR family transcriptional regulator
MYTYRCVGQPCNFEVGELEEKVAKQERAKVTRDTLISAAGVVFANMHYSQATLADVLKIADVSQGSLYFHFKNKHDLASAVVLEQARIMSDVRERVLKEVERPAEILKSTALGVSEAIAEFPQVRAGLRLLIQSAEEFEMLNLDPYTTWLAAVGELKPEVNPEDAAWLFVAAFMGTKDIITKRDDWSELTPRINNNVELLLRLVII